MHWAKITRGVWQLDGATHYAVVVNTTDYDATRTWRFGWHVRIRDDRTGLIVKYGQCHPTRKAAETEASSLLAATQCS